MNKSYVLIVVIILILATSFIIFKSDPSRAEYWQLDTNMIYSNISDMDMVKSKLENNGHQIKVSDLGVTHFYFQVNASQLENLSITPSSINNGYIDLAFYPSNTINITIQLCKENIDMYQVNITDDQSPDPFIQYFNKFFEDEFGISPDTVYYSEWYHRIIQET